MEVLINGDSLTIKDKKFVELYKNNINAFEALQRTLKPDWSTVQLFERKIAEFFGAPYCVAVDSCTHGLELCLRFCKTQHITVPKRTYLSVPMLADKLGMSREFVEWDWIEVYHLTGYIHDAATFWKKDGYKEYADGPDIFMCISFQHQKHLSLGRGGCILCPNLESYQQLKKMSYDGRLPGIPWREQDVDTIGYHYYMTPETAVLGLSKLQDAIDTPPRHWSYLDYPDLTEMKIFKNAK